MITAKKANELSGPDSSEYLDFIEKRIIEAAKSKKKSVTIRDSPYGSWLYKESDLSEAPKEALKILRSNGFELSLYYMESQFVDMGLTIKWG